MSNKNNQEIEYNEIEKMTPDEMEKRINELKIEIASLKVRSDKLNAAVLIMIGSSFIPYVAGYLIGNGIMVISALVLALAAVVPGNKRCKIDDDVEKKEKLIKELDRRIKVAYGLRADDAKYPEEQEDSMLRA